MLPESNICKSSTKTEEDALSKDPTIIYKHSFLGPLHKTFPYITPSALWQCSPWKKGQVFKRLLLVMLLINKAMLFKPLGLLSVKDITDFLSHIGKCTQGQRSPGKT